ALERAVAVDEADREAVDLRLDHVLEARLGDALTREVVSHPLDPCAQLLLGADVAEREHRLQMAHLLQPADRLAAHALGGRVGCEQLRVLALERAQLVQQRVVLVVADLRVVEDVIAARVVLEQLAQLLRAPVRVAGARLRLRPACARLAAHCTSGAGRSPIGGASSSFRSKPRSASRPERSVRSKWIGVTAIRPAATAARSVPGSSWKPGSEPY